MARNSESRGLAPERARLGAGRVVSEVVRRLVDVCLLPVLALVLVVTYFGAVVALKSLNRELASQNKVNDVMKQDRGEEPA